MIDSYWYRLRQRRTRKVQSVKACQSCTTGRLFGPLAGNLCSRAAHGAAQIATPIVPNACNQLQVPNKCPNQTRMFISLCIFMYIYICIFNYIHVYLVYFRIFQVCRASASISMWFLLLALRNCSMWKTWDRASSGRVAPWQATK